MFSSFILNSLNLCTEHKKESVQLNNLKRLQICPSGPQAQKAVALQGRRNTWEQRFDSLSKKKPKEGITCWQWTQLCLKVWSPCHLKLCPAQCEDIGFHQTPSRTSEGCGLMFRFESDAMKHLHHNLHDAVAWQMVCKGKCWSCESLQEVDCRKAYRII